MSKYNGKYKNLISKQSFTIGDSSDFDLDIFVAKNEECTCVEYDKNKYLSNLDEYAPYKVIFKNIKDCKGDNAIQYFAKDEIENLFNIKGVC
jgi:hypothetical protein